MCVVCVYVCVCFFLFEGEEIVKRENVCFEEENGEERIGKCVCDGENEETEKM